MMNLAGHIEEQAKLVDRNPSDPQKDAGNYKKGHVKVHSLDISIENPRGSWRTGGPEGKKWKARLPHHYGYIRKTEGGDGDHVDCFLGPHVKAPNVFVIDQNHLGTGEWDEHKCMLGFGSKKQAAEAYNQAFSDGKGKNRIGHVETMTIEQFKNWLKDGDTTKPVKEYREHFASGGAVQHMADGGIPSFDQTQPVDTGPPPFEATQPVEQPSSGGISDYIPNAISDIPHEIYQAGSDALSAPGKAFDAIQARHAEQAKKDSSPEGSFLDPSALTGTLQDVADTGKAVVSAASLPAAPITGTARSAIGHPMAQAEHIVGGLINPKVAAQDNPDTMYENAKSDVDLAMSAAAAKKAPPISATPAPLKNVPAPTTKELFKAAENNYNNMHGYGVEVHPQVAAQAADNILTELNTQGYRDYLTPKTYRAVEELKNPIGQNSTTQDIEGVRRALNKAAADPAEKDSARRAIAGIDDMMSNLHPNDVAVNPHFADRVGKEAAEARANYAAAKRSEMLDEITKKAERQANSAGSGTNIDNATRQRIKSVLDNPKKLRGFSDDEKDQMEKIVAGTPVGNVARLLGKFSPSGIVSGALSAGAGFAAHGPMGAVAVPAAGYIAKKIGDASTAAQAAKLSRLVRSRSPLGKRASINAAAQSVFAQPSAPGALAAPGISGANLQFPSRLYVSPGVQGPVPVAAGQEKQQTPGIAH
jgi:hypothetical protein